MIDDCEWLGMLQFANLQINYKKRNRSGDDHDGCVQIPCVLHIYIVEL